MMPFLVKRMIGYSMLSGSGIEIGAFEHPAKLPEGCRVEYCDAITPEQAQVLFPEIDTSKFVKVDHIIDLNRDGLSKFPDSTFDFVIINHVLEHLVNPIFIVKEVLRVLKYGGCMVIAVPDKEYTFDKNRPLTSWEHVKDDYEKKLTDSKPEDYIDMIDYVHTHLKNESKETIAAHLQGFKSRREHLHVWNSATFREFLDKTVALVGIESIPLFEVIGPYNQFEYFGVWAKGGEEVRKRFIKRSSLRSYLTTFGERVTRRYHEDGLVGVLTAAKRKVTNFLVDQTHRSDV